MVGVLKASRGSEATNAVGHRAADASIAEAVFDRAVALLEQADYAGSEVRFREVLRLLPEHASTLNNLGTAVWRQGRLYEAEEHYRRALVHDPHDYAIFNNLGNLMWEQGRLDEAVGWFRTAVALQPGSAVALMNLGMTLSDQGAFDEALGLMRESLRLLPGSAESHVNLGNTLARQGDVEAALACYEHALVLRPDFPTARRYRAYLWLARGDYGRGWLEHELRLKCARPRVLAVDGHRWTGETLEGRSLLLVAEQGLGDVLQFLRFAPLVKERVGRVILACPEPLIRLAERCPGVDVVLDWNSPLPVCDAHAYLMSLPLILGTTLVNIPGVPYISVDARTVAEWQPVVARALSDGDRRQRVNGQNAARAFTIGIAWQGNRTNTIDRWRSFPLTHFEHLATLPGVRLISLQMGDGTDQLAELAGRFSVAELSQGTHGDDPRRDFLDTAAVISQLDLVVAPESAVAHLAGGLGRPVWVPLSTVGDWRWLLDRNDSPWYPTMRLFRQTTPGGWDAVFERMARAVLREMS